MCVVVNVVARPVRVYSINCPSSDTITWERSLRHVVSERLVTTFHSFCALQGKNARIVEQIGADDGCLFKENTSCIWIFDKFQGNITCVRHGA